MAINNLENFGRLFFDMSPDPFCVVTADGKFEVLNPAWEKVIGYSLDEMIGKPLVLFLHPDDIEATMHEIELQKTGIETINFINRYRGKDGNYRWFEWRAKMAADGKVYAVARDVSERKTNEEALKQNEEKFRKIFEGIQDVYIMTDLSGTILEVSPSVKRNMLYDREELIGTNVAELYYNKEHRHELIRLVRERGENLDYELQLKNKNGELVWGSVNNHKVVNELGEVVGIETVMRNIHARKIAEEKLKNLYIAVEQSPVSIVISDPKGDIQYANPKAIQTTGYSMEELMGNNPRVLKSGETSDDEYRTLWETISSGRQWSGIFHNKKKDGTLYWESSSISPIFDNEGNITSYVAVKEDITEKKKINDELILSEANLKKVNATKDKLFSIIAHDLRGPIGSFEPILELILSEDNMEKEESLMLLNGLLRNSRTVFSLLENLLNWSKSQSDNLVLNPDYFDIREMARANIELLSPIAGQKSISMILETTGPVHVLADPDTSDLVLRNLLQNAIKFTREQGMIRVKLEEKGALVEVSVEDNGVGMEQKVSENLFRAKSFYTTLGTNNERGSGLGLVLCQDFVERNGGTISVESSPGKGSKFIFTLPSGKP